MKAQNSQLVKDLAILKEHLSQVEEKKKMHSSRISNKTESALSVLMGSDLDFSQYSPEQVAEF